MTQRRERENGGDETSFLAMSLATSSMQSYVLKAMIELEVFEIIKKAGPEAQLSSAQIVAQLATTNPDATLVLDRMLRLMACCSVLTFSLRARPDGGSETVYGLAPVCKYLTRNQDGVSIAPFSILCHQNVVTDVWDNLKDAVLKGGVPFKRTHGNTFFEYLGVDSSFRNTFFNVMNNHSAILVNKILETYDGFEGLSSLADVGGGTGDILNRILTKYPTIKGINFDLPHVVKNAPSYPGVENVGGDMYVSVPQADAIFMKWILHTGSDEQCIKLLKNCHAALPEHGKLIVCEYVAPDAPEASNLAKMTFTLDTIMMSMSNGKERTKGEYEALGKQAGFQGFQLACHVCDSWVIEFLKMK